MAELEVIRHCPDRILTAREQFDAFDAALEIGAPAQVDASRLSDAITWMQEFAGGDQVKREALVSFNRKRWPNGKTIQVYFMEDPPQFAIDRVMELLNRWSSTANIRFEQTRDRMASDVRIGFVQGDGSWSFMGTDCLAIAKDRRTMNLGWLLQNPDDEDEWRRVVVHEAGHTLSFGHEQAHPEGKIDWNRDAVYAFYTGPPNNWSRSQVDAQVFQKYAGEPVTNFSKYDRNSIMHYAIPAKFVLDPRDVVGWNDGRSRLDKRYAALWYPKPKLQEQLDLLVDQMAREFEQQLERGDNA